MFYTGSLTLEQIADGITVALKNADELLEEAQILYDNGRYARATALIVLAEEEMGKHLLILDSIKCRNDAKCWKRFWSEFRSHHKKFTNALALGYLYAACDLDEIINEANLLSCEANLTKQLALYVDFNGTYFWIPSKLFNKMFVEKILKITKREIVNIKRASEDNTLAAVKKIAEDLEKMRQVDPNNVANDELLTSKLCELIVQQQIPQLKELEEKYRRLLEEKAGSAQLDNGTKPDAEEIKILDDIDQSIQKSLHAVQYYKTKNIIANQQ